MLVDEVVITVRAGQGGRGCVAFRREKFVPRGGPAGGDGGDGGDVVFAVDPNLNSLDTLRRRAIWRAQDGGPGEGDRRRGRNGEDLVIRVPPGTLIYDADRGALLKDLSAPGQKITIARGGRGGRGNARFATATNQAPRKAEPGEPGEERRLRIELKMIADVGIVGLPNAGKSTLLTRLSRARPKVAAYPFTTLAPHLGVVSLDEFTTFTVADLPGMMEGAHEGRGLGDRFLRHVERTRILLHLVDVSPQALRPPREAYRIIREEIRAYSDALARKPEIVAANKTDVEGAEDGVRALREVAPGAMALSAATGDGVAELVDALARALGLRAL
jgi:GTP-binding protein